MGRPKGSGKTHKYTDATYAANKEKKQQRHEKTLAKMRIKAAERKEKKRLAKLAKQKASNKTK